MKIHRNYLSTTFCPVTWLLIYIRYAGITTGPIFQLQARKGHAEVGEWIGVDVVQWTRMLNHWFEQAGLRTPGSPARRATDDAPAQAKRKPQGCSTHSIRRTSAQWAGRCGAREMDVRNAGRWQTMQVASNLLLP